MTSNIFSDPSKSLFAGFKRERVKEEPSQNTTQSPAQTQSKKIEGGITDSTEAKHSRGKGCVHLIALPPNHAGNENDPNLLTPKYPENPTRTWKFELDPFQKTSISCIEQNESILVAAHTSAGKTVVAEYAIAKGLSKGTKVIYTSPIKALSNQKYRDLQEIFSDVGLMTGDITTNPNASCLVMTTEILRNMLYQGNEIMRQVSWVIFDEIHYMRNKERGVVWEETIIMLPDAVRYVFLSATIPNAEEFAMWIAKIHSQVCHVVTTDMRPVPLQHYLFPAGSNKIHLVVNEKGDFIQDNFLSALSQLVPDVKRRDKQGKRTHPDIYRIIKMIMENNFEPAIVFAFSKKEVEMLARSLSRLDFNSDREKELVDKIFKAAINSLSPQDQQLPQIVHILPLLSRGIGIHHSGLLPIVKEVVEILFQEGLIKVLFATETFAMGLNMPAKTVVFTNVRKYDGTGFRTVTSGEYIQMSGRAGRRGLDEKGIVILTFDERLEPAIIKDMVFGEADPLNSAFYIGYNMMLNLFRVEGGDPQFLIDKSFRQFQANNSLPDMKQKVELLKKEYNEIVIEDIETISEYYYLKTTHEEYKKMYCQRITDPKYCVGFLQPGRLVKVCEGSNDYGWGAVVNYSKKTLNDTARSVVFIVEGLFNVDISPLASDRKVNRKPLPAVPGKPSEPQIVPFNITQITAISEIIVHLPTDIRSVEARNKFIKTMDTIKTSLPQIPLLDPSDMGIEDAEFETLGTKIRDLEARVFENKAFQKKSVRDGAKLFAKRVNIEKQIKTINREIKHAKDIILKDELHSMKSFLRRLRYIDERDVIQPKGQVAAVLSAGDEILLTELIFSGFFNNLSESETAAMLSVFVTEEKSNDETGLRLPDKLAVPFRLIQSEARSVSTVMQECKLQVETEEYVQRFRPGLIEVAFDWAEGKTFGEILKQTEVFEGNVIRVLRRLDELLKELVTCAEVMRNKSLETKFSATSTKIRRDIVFAASLYL